MNERPTARVLLAEDDERLRRVLGAYFRRAGFEVREARDGEALRVLVQELAAVPRAAGLPDILVSDVGMPGVSGIEGVRLLREHGLTIPVILVTAHLTEAVAEEARTLDVAAVLEKPVDLPTLLSAVRIALTWR